MCMSIRTNVCIEVQYGQMERYLNSIEIPATVIRQGKCVRLTK